MALEQEKTSILSELEVEDLSKGFILVAEGAAILAKNLASLLQKASDKEYKSTEVKVEAAVAGHSSTVGERDVRGMEQVAEELWKQEKAEAERWRSSQEVEMQRWRSSEEMEMRRRCTLKEAELEALWRSREAALEDRWRLAIEVEERWKSRLAAVEERLEEEVHWRSRLSALEERLEAKDRWRTRLSALEEHLQAVEQRQCELELKLPLESTVLSSETKATSSRASPGKTKEQQLESRMTTLEASVHRALEYFFPRVDALLSQQERLGAEGLNSSLPATAVYRQPQTTPWPKLDHVESSNQGEAQSVGNNAAGISQNTLTAASGGRYYPPLEWQLKTQKVASPRGRNDLTSQSTTPSRVKCDPALGRQLMEAAEDCNVDSLAHILDEGADLTMCDDTGMSALHSAAASGSIRFISVLLGHCFSVDERTIHGCTPLHCAAAQGRTICVRELIRLGADVQAMDDAGSTPLHCAAKCGEKETARALLEAGACVDATDSQGWTPLHVAAYWAREGVVRELLDAGANVKMWSHSGKTPIDVVRSQGVRKLLKKQ